MKKLLYITANPNAVENSFGLSVGEAFIEEYKRVNPTHEVVHFDLFKENVPAIDGNVLDAWGKLGSGVDFAELSAEQQQTLAAMNKNLELFMGADEYVFVTPMWNLSFPSVVKNFIDNFTIAGKTFKYSENGPMGLLENKKALHIQASGSVFSHGPITAMNFNSPYLKTMLNFVGITDVSNIFVEGMAAMADQAQEIKAKAIAEAKELAVNFSKELVMN
ncbi:NAD(P)H-dependent oxidoreductase [Bacillus sp. RG28]|uniref:FMN dependent NADH:quinone oxidoreductase n=1 Tax=Gottfriedia endophytica TaxID=2820819 RepID=A0A940NN45_9BACI|nr:NAD(P)H-dependent oxidoreductase [Gottfriedia endophytica]MBP0725661.1 NAD(P)H-dependent oxidoreductase [Gottfriedia endophytica]